MRYRLLRAVYVASSGLLCGPVNAHDIVGPLSTADPFGYCKAADSRDSVRRLPRKLSDAAASAFGLSPGAGGSETYYWRCMHGSVYVCAVGANIPCQSKADTARRNIGAQNYCREQPNAPLVPAFAAGHRTIYEWHCLAGAAVRGKAVAHLDDQGFQSEFWRRLVPAGGD